MNIFTQNPDFYPTPAEVIEQMTVGESVAGKVVLEPSAGKGNIVDWLAEHGAARVLACETDPRLRAILQAGGRCELIAEDFLSLRSEDVSHVDMIVMNPPYSHDIEHITHAYDIAPAGCTVIALCNDSHLQRGFINNREMCFRELIEEHGYSEHLGSCFAGSERDTNVNVALVKLYKGGQGASEFDGFVFDGAPNLDAAGGSTPGVMSYDFIRDIVTRYCRAVSAFDEVKAKADEINALAQFPGAGPYNQPPIKFCAVSTDSNKNFSVVSHDRYKKELQKYFWRIIFQKMDLQKYATRQLREQINRFVERQQHVPFTMKNIYNVIDIIFQTNGQRMQNAVCEAFDTICGFSAENSTAGEKWRTNSDYMVNRKFIVPYIAEGYNWGNEPYETVRIQYGSNTDLVEDVVKALCYITGTAYGTFPEFREAGKGEEWGKWFEWAFFRCKAFKKGTVHFEFLSEDVWAKFNQSVASVRGWNLPKTPSSRKRDT